MAPATKEVVTYVASVGTWSNRIPCQVSWTGVDGSTAGNIYNALSIVEPLSPVLILIVSTYPPCGIEANQKVVNKWQSTSHGSVGHTQILDAAVDTKFPNDLDSEYISSKAIGHNLYDGSSSDLYTLCRMNFAADIFQAQTTQFMDSGFSTINTLDKAVVSVSSLPESEGLRMVLIGACRNIFLVR